MQLQEIVPYRGRAGYEGEMVLKLPQVLFALASQKGCCLHPNSNRGDALIEKSLTQRKNRALGRRI